MRFTRQQAVDTLITLLIISCGSWAGAKIFGSDTWHCYNNVMDYFAIGLEIRECMYRPGTKIFNFIL